MNIITVDDLRVAQKTLSPKRFLPLPVPIDVDLHSLVDATFFSPREDFMKNPWAFEYVQDGVLVRLNNSVSGISLDSLSMEILTRQVTPFTGVVTLWRYDLSRKCVYEKIKEHVPEDFIFESSTFSHLLSTLLMRGTGQGRRFLRSNHSNIFFVRHPEKEEIVAVYVRFSSEIMKKGFLKGWVITSEVVDVNYKPRCDQRLYVHRSTKTFTS